MVRSVHDEPRELDRIADVGDTCDGARGERGAVHDGGVHRDDTALVEIGAATRVEERRVLHHADGGDGRVHGATAGRERLMARVQRLGQRGTVRRVELGRHLGARDHAHTAVNDDAEIHTKV